MTIERLIFVKISNSYNPKNVFISENWNEIGKNLELLLSKYDHFMLMATLMQNQLNLPFLIFVKSII